MAKHSFKIAKPVKEKNTLLINKSLPELSAFLDSKVLKSKKVQKDLLHHQNLTSAILDDVLVNAENEEEDRKEVKSETVKFPLSPLKNTKTEEDIINEFSQALVAGDIATIGLLLADKGEYVVISEKFELLVVNKTDYLIWLGRKSEKQPVTSFHNDFCDGCFKGKSIMFYNDGSFPWNVLEEGTGRKAAFKFYIAGNKIIGTRFCHNFTNKQNKMDYPKYKELYAKYRSMGYSIDETIRLSKEEWSK